MIIHTAGKRSLAFFFNEGEFCPAERDRADEIRRLERIAKETFQKKGIEAGSMEIEAYEGRSGTVVFISAEEKVCRLLYSFEKMTDAAGAAKQISERLAVDSALYEMRGVYYLKVFVRAGSLPRAQWALDEFGKQEESGEILSAHLEEMGRLVLPHRAVALLTRFW